MLKLSKGNKGFTLVEILIVLGMLVVLGTIVLSVINPNGQMKKARDARRKSDLAQYRNLLEVTANKYNGLYIPTSGNPFAMNSIWTCLGQTGTEINDPLNNQNSCQGATPTTPTACTYRYRANGSGNCVAGNPGTFNATEYVLYAPLEKPITSTTGIYYWEVCSNGKSGETNVAPTSSACTLP